MTDLYCFPHSGGFSYQFRALGQVIAPLSPRPVDYPKVGARDGSPEGVGDFVRRWLASCDGVDFGGACLYGQSLGGLMAFEAAVQLEQRGTPAAGVVIAAALPFSHSAMPRLDYELCSQEELLDWSFGTVQGREPSGAEREVFRWLSPRLRRDLRMYAGYTPDGRLDLTPALVLQATGDRVCPPPTQHYWAERISRLDWREIDAGHLFHMDAPAVTAAAVRDWRST
ncbi:alpha/beta fold hydrolase [Streptomyces sp. SL13]|jgi:surfactin synthase thioesterase subunit|uniref:Alpha/beta fold hydrolase n=1 Tax=Streptantibioticus silvisoli TaxID=2705255 RepID=A0AA90KGL6_9ACTN|nr:alpha/beta fold hydrolase [Streptantibioticus silvisoli]MDI5962310.1 alpha/beta fold hydrolase [Streptantibioticus silvisoli]MDI5970740.1 alpha/beta fold hydrolase [Streptantibioticus silvisoli]